MTKLMQKIGESFDSEEWSGSVHIPPEGQKDVYNCGTYVACYAKCFLTGTKMVSLGNMDSERVS